TGIFGPVLGPDVPASVAIFQRLLTRMPLAPRIYMGVVDVRDVADLHLRAMTRPEARGERFIATSGGVMSIREIAAVLRERLPDLTRNAPRHELPSWIGRLTAPLVPEMSTLLPLLDRKRAATSAKAERVLGWRARPREETLVDTVTSLARVGALPG